MGRTSHFERSPGWEDRLIDDLPHRARLVGVVSPERSPAR